MLTIFQIVQLKTSDSHQLESEHLLLHTPHAFDTVFSFPSFFTAAPMLLHQALLHPWIMEGGTATSLPLEGSVVQRLQRFATYGDLKQLVLKRISELTNGTGANVEKCTERHRSKSLNRFCLVW